MTAPDHPYQFLITAIMPALNEELCLDASVDNVLDVFNRLGICGELIIVNDGSSDRTGALADARVKWQQCIQAIHHENCRGIGASFWDGVQHSRGEIVVFIPGDGENDAEEIFRYLPLLEQVDIVVPFVYNPEVRSRFRQRLSALFTRIVCLFFGLSLNYLNGTVMYRRSILEGIDLRSNGFFYQAEILIKTIRRGYLYAEVPYALKQRNAGASKAVSIATMIKVFRDFASVFRSVHFAGLNGNEISCSSVTAKRVFEQRAKGACEQ
ncbi:undecaprenyl-phosphate mannosyltransferase [Geobacter sp. OR-1]|uniref:glycosyltransferase family 2 protein n=1 Tax=Geobacter sp. OR-1 TaxID=1266765 RepID=UPI0005443198|nr:glycosyltransferase family 2 protein [Geobacter sp. OR-1]GAM10554.1 undecaprenyl-phosphate mannosyltransferase [Geobacter sp. OR-1]